MAIVWEVEPQGLRLVAASVEAEQLGLRSGLSFEAPDGSLPAGALEQLVHACRVALEVGEGSGRLELNGSWQLEVVRLTDGRDRATRLVGTMTAQSALLPEPPWDELAMILQRVADGVTAQSSDGRLLYANDAAARATGFASAAAMLTATISEIVERFELADEQGRPIGFDALPGRAAFQGIESTRLVRFRIRSTGEVRWSVVRAAPIFADDGSVRMAINVFHDVTDVKRAEEAQRFLATASQLLSESLDHQQTLTSLAALSVPALADWCFIHVVDATGRIVPLVVHHADPEKLKLALAMGEGTTMEERAVSRTREVIRSGQSVLIPELPHELLVESAGSPEELAQLELLGLRSVLIVPLVARGATLGAIIYANAESGRRLGPAELALAEDLARRAALAMDNARLYEDLVRDVGARRSAVEELARSEERFRRTFDGSPIAICVVTQAQGRVLDVNPAFLRLLGYDRDQVLHRTLEDINIWGEAEAARRFDDRMLHRGQVGELETSYRTRDGELRRVLISGESVELGGERCHLLLAHDVTARRELEEQLRQAQKMEAIGRLAGGVAHDFNNILTAITGYSELLIEQLGAKTLLRHAEQIHRAAARGSSLTQRLLAFSRKQMLQSVVLDLRALISNLEKMLHRLIGEDVELVTVLPDDVVRVRADPVQIEQVIINLVVNARDAMPKGGWLSIGAGNVELDAEFAHKHVGIEPGSYAVITVKDTGCGIDRETQARIFEPFFTTKEKGKGTGLGLATVYGVVKQSGGHILVESEPGRGATFTIYLPRFDEAQKLHDSGPIRVVPPAAPPASETVLVVEDEEAVRDLVCRMMKTQGYTVLTASGGRQALDLAERHQGSIQLLITDVIMPQMSGPEVAEQLVERRPGLRVLYMSGYPGDAIVSRGLLGPHTHLLEKPFTRLALSRKVRDVLDGLPGTTTPSAPPRPRRGADRKG